MTGAAEAARDGGLTLRRATQEDATILWEWANEARVREQSFHQEPIAWEEHVRWLAARLRSPECAVWILERSGHPVGQIRYERTDDRTAAIDFSVARSERGLGLGSHLLSASVEPARAALGVSVLVGLVKQMNVSSARAFLRAGYSDEGEVTVRGQRCRRYVLRQR